MDRAFDRFEEAPEGRGGAVAQDRALATGEHSGHPAPMPAEASVSHGVDAAVDSVQLTASDAISDRPRPQSCAFELSSSDHAVLA